MNETDQAAESILAVLNFTHALTGLGGGAFMLLLIGFAGKAIFAKFREGLVLESDIKDDKGEYIFGGKEHLLRIDKKEQKTRNSVMKIAGHIDIDLPELAD